MPPGLLSNFVERQADGRYLVFTDVAFAREDANQVMREVTKAPHVFVLEPFFYCRDMVEIVHDD